MRGGAKEVGLATTQAVVAGSVSVLVSDYFLIDMFHILWPVEIVTPAPMAPDPTSRNGRPRPPSGTENLARRDERWQIRVRNLHKTFGPQHVLRGVDLDIERGQTTSSSAARGRASRC